MGNKTYRMLTSKYKIFQELFAHALIRVVSKLLYDFIILYSFLMLQMSCWDYYYMLAFVEIWKQLVYKYLSH